MLGKTNAEGVFQDFTGRVRRRFSVELLGAMAGPVLELREAFRFDDGATEDRVWRISPRGDRYTATADDMIGEAAGGLQDGVLKWSYLFSLKLGERRLRVRFHESFIQVTEGLVLNAARVSKFGFQIGRTTIIFRK